MSVRLDQGSLLSAGVAQDVIFSESDVRHLEVGLVNNMPDAALESTERQFTELLAAAAPDIVVRLRLYSLPEVPRGEGARRRLCDSYADVNELWASRLDGVIVTGTEPQAASLPDEPYWTSLTRVADWAEHNAVSSIWSCLAAHAAVLYTDGIARRALPDKRFGLFECTRAAGHALMQGIPPQIRVPHSRFNELPEEALTSAGYLILTRSDVAGVDTFARQRKSLSVYCQGHPEYDGHALLREYRRDIGRFLRGQRDRYPAAPEGYFDRTAAACLAAFREQALSRRHEDLLDSFPAEALTAALVRMGPSPATRLYGNWLSHLSLQKARRLGARPTVSRQRRAAPPVAVGGVG